MLDPSLFPAPHREKILSASENPRLPARERPRLQQALERYGNWRTALERTLRGGGTLAVMVELLNTYRHWLDLDLIFDSDDEFLYRQKGQLKLDNSVIEEFLPFVIAREFPEEIAGNQLQLGPRGCFSSIRFESSPLVPTAAAGVTLRTKDHDFAISRPIFLKASHHATLDDARAVESSLAYVAAECKTNLDKTMFQEAAATAQDVKTAVPGARYYLLCEWLDMTPISTSTTPIDEVIVLRKSKRLAANIRSHFSSAEGRKAQRDVFLRHIEENPFAEDAVERFVGHVRSVVVQGQDAEEEVLQRGYF